MTLTLRETVQSLYGAWRLARFDATGMTFLERTPEGALRSFWAAAIVAPGYFLLVLLLRAELAEADGAQLPLLPFLVVEAIAFVATWAGFALAMFHIARALGRAERYFGFLAAYNWSAVIQMTAFLPAVALDASGLLPQAATQSLLLVVRVVLLAYQWFVARTALEVDGLMAAAVVMLDVVLSVMISQIAEGMVR